MIKTGVLAAGIAAFSLLTFSTQAAPEPVSMEKDGVRVEITLDKTELMVGEPLHVMLRATNFDAPIKIGTFGLRPFYAEGNDLDLQIQRPGELPVRYQSVEPPGVYTTIEQDLDFGESVHFEYPVLYDKTQKNGYAFSQPGEYLLNLKVHFTILREPERSVLNLNNVKVTVRQPTGEALEAFKLIDNPEAAMAYQFLVTDNKTILSAARVIAEKYPETPYGAPSVYMLGASEMRMEEGNFTDALARMKQFLKQYPGHLRTSAALFNIITCNIRLNQLDLARDWFYYLRDHDPAYHLIRKENPIAKRFYYQPDEAARTRRWWMYEKPWDIREEKPAGQGQ